MLLYPAIDLKSGQCVRLAKGRANEVTIYNENPASQAKQFADQGCSWLHVVDLDGAFEGTSRNSSSVADILSEVNIPVQLGGGLRDLKSIESWLSAGVARVVLGTVAVETPQIAIDAAREFPDRVAIGIDARGGFAATHGWVADTEISAGELARRFEDCGIAAIIYTDIDRDGVKTGPNVHATCKLANSLTIPVIASGGVSSTTELQVLRQECPIVNGVVVGRALYDGSMTVADALMALEQKPV